LPKEFSRKEVTEIGTKLNLSATTVDDVLKSATKNHLPELNLGTTADLKYSITVLY
jgi:hypothetical protein